MKIIDNIQIEKARELFEQGVKSVTQPLIATETKGMGE